MISPETMVGSKCSAATSLTPEGYVRVGSELWKALATSSIIHKDEEVVIVGINGLTVLVAPVDSSNHEAGGAKQRQNRHGQS